MGGASAANPRNGSIVDPTGIRGANNIEHRYRRFERSISRKSPGARKQFEAAPKSTAGPTRGFTWHSHESPRTVIVDSSGGLLRGTEHSSGGTNHSNRRCHEGSRRTDNAEPGITQLSASQF